MEMELLSSNLDLLPSSFTFSDGMEFSLARTVNGRKLAILCDSLDEVVSQFDGECSEFGRHSLMVCPLNTQNAASLRSQFDWLKPRLTGLHTSAGMGDRLGIATPGHVRAMRGLGEKLIPIFAQQSIREMKRTGRTAQQVMDDATWGIFEEGWQAGVGADADHLKTLADIDTSFAAGFTFFTFDPGEYVDQSSHLLPTSMLSERLTALPADLQPGATGLLGRTFDVEGHRINMSEAALSRAAVKYGSAVEHIVKMYHHLQSVAGLLPFEVEISMDETEQPTSPVEHIYIASELKRHGIRWISFAPRFVGRFEKGVDYIGDIDGFEADVAVHAAIARQLGPYKLSLHSGSDKFSIYSIFVEATQGLAHLKTAGTSYLEALKTIAELDQVLMGEIYRFSLGRFEQDKHSYHISADLKKAPKPDEVKQWSDLFALFDTREILHVTFGSVLSERMDDGSFRFYDRIMTILEDNREAYFENLVQHFKRHLLPFTGHRKQDES